LEKNSMIDPLQEEGDEELIEKRDIVHNIRI
jgi:hypothetical protein